MNSKEELRQKRKEAYQRAKTKRDADPRYQALKEKAKAERRAKYRAFKDAQKQARLLAKQERIAEKDKALMGMVVKGVDWEDKREMRMPTGNDL
jgi:hypothetical protein